MAGQQVVVSVLADTKKFQRAMSKLGDETGMNKLAGKFKSAGKAIGVSMAAAGVAVTAVAVKATQAASSLEQSIGGVDAVFKGNAKQIHSWASSAASDLGLSKNSYNELATIVGSQLKNMGMAQDEVAGKTNDLVKVGADLAATFGGTTADAVGAVSALLRGEADPIERYGVSIKKADVNARLAAKGLKGLKGEALKQAEAMATLELLSKQTADAQGAFGRESNTLAGQQERLKAKFENISATLGTYFLPVATKVTAWFSDNLEPAFKTAQEWIQDKVVPAFQMLGEWFNTNKPALEAFAVQVKTLAEQGFTSLKAAVILVKDALIEAGAWIKNNSDWLIPLAAAIAAAVLSYQSYVKVLAIWKATQTAVTAAQWALNAAMAANPIGLVIAAVAALVAGLALFFTKTEVGRKIWDTVWTAIQEGFSAFVDWIKPILADITSAWTATWSKVKKVWAVVGPPLIAVIKAQLGQIKIIFTTVFNVIKTVVSGVFNGIKIVIQTAMSVIQGVIKAITSAIKGDWQSAWEGIKQVFGSMLDGIIGLAKNSISGMLNVGKQIIDGLWQGIQSGFGKIKDGLGWLTDKLTDWKGPKDKDKKLLTPAGKAVMNGFLKGLQSGFSGVRESLTGFTNDLVKWQEKAIKTEADRLIEARRQANRKIDKYNKSRQKGQAKKDKLPTLTRAEATKQAKKNLQITESQTKAAQKLIKAQSKKTDAVWAGGKYKGSVDRWKGMSLGTARILKDTTNKGNFKKNARDSVKAITLADVGKAQDEVNKALSKAKDTIASMKEARAQMKAQIADSIKGELDLASSIKPAVEDTYETIQKSDGKGNIWHETKLVKGSAAKATFASVAGNIKSMAAKAKAFALKLQALVKKGIPEGLVQEIATLGTENGGAVADALLSGSSAQVKELSADYASLNTWSAKAGETVAGQMYDAGINATQGLIDGLEKDKAKLDAVAEKLAETLTDSIKKALGIKSPSRVFKKLGGFTVEGMRLGLEGGYAKTEASVRSFSNRLADVPFGLQQPTPVAQASQKPQPEKIMIDPKSFAAAFEGTSLTLVIDGKPVKGVIQAEVRSMISAVGRGY